jgi:hypothetical protein
MGMMLSIPSSSEEYLELQTNGEASNPSSCLLSQLRQQYDVRFDDPESSDPTDMKDMVRRDDDDEITKLRPMAQPIDRPQSAMKQ